MFEPNTKRRRINHNCYCFFIGIHPHLQTIGVECAVRVFPTPEEGDPRFKLPKSRHKKMQLPPLSNTWPLRKHFNQVYYVEECFFLRKKIDWFWADTANTDIHNLAYFLILSQCVEKCRKDWKLALKEDRLVKSRILGTSLKFKEPRY